MTELCVPRIGTYEPLLELAAGGMGMVYVARKLGDAGFERLVVLKRVHRHLLEDPDFHAMLRDEARVASLLRHPHVVPVIDVVEANGELSLVFDYVESFSLAELMAFSVAQKTRIPLPIAARIMHDALAGLHAAHEAVDMQGKPLDLIHRDVSPQNVIVGIDGTSRIIDFGIAKATARLSQTGQGIVKGKLRYMSPEQAKQGTIDRRSDVFSAGVVLYEAVTGKRLFPAEDVGDIFLSILLGDVTPPSEVVPALPQALDAVVLQALSGEREDRFATAVQFEEALERAVPLAPAREVARYVEQQGGKLLEARREKLRELARASAAGHGAPVSEPPAELIAPLEPTVAAPASEPPPKMALWKRVAIFAGGTAILGIGAAKARSHAAHDPQVSAASATTHEAPPALDEPAEAVSLPRATRSASPPEEPHAPVKSRPRARPHPTSTGSDLHRNPYGRPQ